MTRPEVVSWSDGIARRFHRSAKARPKLTLAFQQARLLLPTTVLLYFRAVHSSPTKPNDKLATSPQCHTKLIPKRTEAVIDVDTWLRGCEHLWL